MFSTQNNGLLRVNNGLSTGWVRVSNQPFFFGSKSQTNGILLNHFEFGFRISESFESAFGISELFQSMTPKELSQSSLAWHAAIRQECSTSCCVVNNYTRMVNLPCARLMDQRPVSSQKFRVHRAELLVAQAGLAAFPSSARSSRRLLWQKAQGRSWAPGWVDLGNSHQL